MLRFGDVVLTQVQYTDTLEMKRRPAVVLFESYGNVVVAGVTSNLAMKGVSLTRKEGAVQDSVIKLNYIFTISNKLIEKKIFSITSDKKEELKRAFISLLK